METGGNSNLSNNTLIENKSKTKLTMFSLLNNMHQKKLITGIQQNRNLFEDH